VEVTVTNMKEFDPEDLVSEQCVVSRRAGVIRELFCITSVLSAKLI